MTKSDVWAHEHEWRIVCVTEEEFLPFDCVSGVFLGVGFDMNAAKYENLFKAVMAHGNIDIHKCILNREKYQIDSTKIHDAGYLAAATNIIVDGTSIA